MQMTVTASNPEAFRLKLDGMFQQGWKIVPDTIIATSLQRTKMLGVDQGDGPFFEHFYCAIVTQ